MCGRFVLMIPGKSLAAHFRLADEPELEPRYNIAPTELIAIVRAERDPVRRELRMVKWGLMPPWTKDPAEAAKLINARSETVAEKPSFRSAFRHRRCLIPATGFYEWKKAKGKKLPYLFGRADGGVFAFAGLWERWQGRDDQVIETATILTTDANERLQEIHDRMPVILSPEDYDLWLDSGVQKPELLKPLLRPYPAEEMSGHPVSPKVNRAGVEGPDLIEPVPEAAP